MQILAKVVTLLMVLTSFAARMVEENPATVETFPLYHNGRPLCFTGKNDKWGDPMITACSDSTKKMIEFEWADPYLTCVHSEFFRASRKHYFAKAVTYDDPFAAWDADTSNTKYQWKKNGNFFTNKKFDYEVEKPKKRFNLMHRGKPLCFTHMHSDGDAMIGICSSSTKQMIEFEWNGLYLTCYHSEFAQPGRRHYFGIAYTDGSLFAAWDANKDKRYQWGKDGNLFTNKYSDYEVERADESINNLHVQLEPMLQIHGDSSGTLVKTIKYKKGYSSTNRITSEINAKLSAEVKVTLIKLPIEGGVSSELSHSLQSSAELSVNEEFEDETQITVDLGKPLYVYLTTVSFNFFGSDYTAKGGLVTSPVPLHT